MDKISYRAKKIHACKMEQRPPIAWITPSTFVREKIGSMTNHENGTRVKSISIFLHRALNNSL